MNNFNSTIEILSGLNITAVARLKSLWHKISPHLYDEYKFLDETFSPKDNFYNYRNILIECEESPLPVLPYIGLFLKDVTYIIEGNQQLNCIDLFGEQMFRLKKFRKTQFRFPVNDDLHFYITNLDGSLNEDDLYNISLKIQPTIDFEDEREKKSGSSPFLFRSPLNLRKSSSNLHKLHSSPKKKEKEEKPSLPASPVASRTKSQTNSEKPSLIRSISRRARSLVHSENDTIPQNDIIPNHDEVIVDHSNNYKVEKGKRSHPSFLNFFGVGK